MTSHLVLNPKGEAAHQGERIVMIGQVKSLNVRNLRLLPLASCLQDRMLISHSVALEFTTRGDAKSPK